MGGVATVILLKVPPRSMAPEGLRELRAALARFRGTGVKLEVGVAGRLVRMPDEYDDCGGLRATLSEWGEVSEPSGHA